MLYAVIHFDNTILYHYVMFTNLQRTWAHVQARRAYPVYIWELDQLSPDDVVWEPYSVAAVASRAPLSLSSVCTDNQGLWMTTTAMVFDIAVEPHCPDRVMRQFGLRQLFPLPPQLARVPYHEHRYF